MEREDRHLNRKSDKETEKTQIWKLRLLRACPSVAAKVMRVGMSNVRAPGAPLLR